MFKSGNYALVEFGNLKTIEDWLYYLLIFLFIPIVCVVIFIALMYFSFRMKNSFYFILIILAILAIEYALYTWLASQADLTNGIYNGVLTILLFILFFFNRVKAIY